MAWTITPTIDSKGMIQHPLTGDTAIVLKLACTADGAGAGSITLRSDIAGGTKGTTGTNSDIMDQIANSVLYMIITDPGAGAAEPTSTFTITVSDKNSIAICTTDANAVDADAITQGAQSAGVLPPVFEEITVAVGAIGDANTVDVYLYFWK